LIDLDDIPLDRQTLEQHRARYDALRNQAQARSTRTVPRTVPVIGDADVLRRETIPGGWYWSTVVPKNWTLRVHSPAGGASVAIVLWNARDTSERFNAPDTMKLQWTVRLGTGQLLLSDMGRVLAAVAADNCGRHDMLLGGSAADTGRRNTRDNLRLAAGKHGLDRRDIPPCLTLFADVRAGADGAFAWHGAGPAGSAIDLRAEMDLLVALSNTPHPLHPGAAPGPVEAIIWDGGAVAEDDPCRTAGPEAQRAYENNAGTINVRA